MVFKGDFFILRQILAETQSIAEFSNFFSKFFIFLLTCKIFCVLL